jgi:hypothetical protein
MFCMLALSITPFTALHATTPMIMIGCLRASGMPSSFMHSMSMPTTRSVAIDSLFSMGRTADLLQSPV